MVVTRFGQPRLSRAKPLSQDSPDVVPTGISLWPRRPLRWSRRGTARWSTRVSDSVTFRGRDYELTLAGVGSVPALGSRLRAGVRSPMSRRALG